VSSPRKPPDDDATWPTVDPSITVPQPMRAFEPHEILPLDPGNLDEEAAEAEWQALIAAAREDGDEGPAFPFLPGETAQDRLARIVAGFAPAPRTGTPIEGPVSQGHAAAIYYAPTHAVPAPTPFAHPKGRVQFDRTEKLPIVVAKPPLAPTTPSALVLPSTPPFDPARHAPTVRLPRPSASLHPSGLPQISRDSARSLYSRLTAAFALLIAVATIAIAMMLHHHPGPPTDNLVSTPTATSEAPVPPSVLLSAQPQQLRTVPIAPTSSAPPPSPRMILPASSPATIPPVHPTPRPRPVATAQTPPLGADIPHADLLK